jgi:tetratricopeptide (TPR) repeat protein
MNSQFYYSSALAEGKKGNLNAALSNFDQAISLEPDNSLFHFERGNLYLAIRNYNKAIQDYFQAIRINPNYADVYFNLGYAHTDLHEHEKAIDFFSKAINIKPNLAEAYVSRAINYSIHGNYLAALDDANMGEKLAVAQNNFLTIKNAREIKQKINIGLVFDF